MYFSMQSIIFMDCNNFSVATHFRFCLFMAVLSQLMLTRQWNMYVSCSKKMALLLETSGVGNVCEMLVQ